MPANNNLLELPSGSWLLIIHLEKKNQQRKKRKQIFFSSLEGMEEEEGTTDWMDKQYSLKASPSSSSSSSSSSPSSSSSSSTSLTPLIPPLSPLTPLTSSYSSCSSSSSSSSSYFWSRKEVTTWLPCCLSSSFAGGQTKKRIFFLEEKKMFFQQSNLVGNKKKIVFQVNNNKKELGYSSLFGNLLSFSLDPTRHKHAQKNVPLGVPTRHSAKRRATKYSIVINSSYLHTHFLMPDQTDLPRWKCFSVLFSCPCLFTDVGYPVPWPRLKQQQQKKGTSFLQGCQILRLEKK